MKQKFMIILALALFLGASFKPFPDTVGEGHAVLYKAYKGLEEFGVFDAWKMGFTGQGVNVAVMDSGVDFGSPDLIGTQARVKVKDSPYYGWPIVVDLFSLSEYQKKRFGGNSQYVDTSSTDTKGFKLPGTSKSGVYHIGDHPDRNLVLYNGRAIKVLLVDEEKSGIYDTVYIDLNNNRDFSDDKACRLGNEISYWDRDGDSYPDESGGMIYFVADGKTPLPFSRMLYGEKARVPKNGELVAFQFDAYSHGTMCAGTIAAQGRSVKGIAPGAKIIPVRSYGGNELSRCLLTSLGYDGLPNTGDEAQIISRSASFSYFQKGTDEVSSFLEYLATKVSPSTICVYGSGNFGAGYGTCGSPAGEHVIQAGANIDLWWKDSSHRGDVICFSSRGPNILGHVKPNVLGTGYFSPRIRPLSYTHEGKSAWDMHGGGTSNATPHTAAVLALIYQAYKDTHGEFPRTETARDILMASATDIQEEVFAQGSGVINARRAVEIASGRNAVLIQPAYLITKPVEAGSTLDFRFAISNYSGKSLSLKPLKLFKKSETSFKIKAENDKYLFPIEKKILTGDLVKVSSYSAKDIHSRTLDDTVGYILYLYNWKDLNHDGKYGPGPSIPHEKAQKEELSPIAISDWDHIITSEVRIHDPQRRVDEGIVLELKKTCELLKRHVEMKSRDVTIVIETYEWRKWDGFHISHDKDEIRCRVQTPEGTGVYQGKIQLEIEGSEKNQCIPISFATYRKDEIRAINTSEIYENAKLYARFEGSARMGFRDARFYPIRHDGDDLVAIDISWEDPGTDVDIMLYGEGSIDTSKMWEYSTKSPVELPVLPVLKENGHSTRKIREIPCFILSPAKEKRIVGSLKKGLNVLVLNLANSAGNLYGENISIKIWRLGPELKTPIKIQAKAGESIKYASAEIDRIAGFGEEKRINFREHVFEAKKGDLVVLHPEGPYYFTSLFLDTNENGKVDEFKDDVILMESQTQQLQSYSDDIVRIPKDGKYFLSDFQGKFYHIKEKYENRDGDICIETFQKVGNYIGIAEKEGNLLPLYFALTIEPGEASHIKAVTPASIFNQRPFELKLKVCDRFGNLVKADMPVTVEFEGTTKKSDLKKGEGKITLTAPGQERESVIKVKSQYGLEEVTIKVTKGPSIEISKLSIQEDGIVLKLHNWEKSKTEVKVFANPSCYLLPELLSSPGISLYSPFYEKGYTRGYLPHSAQTALSLSEGEEKEVIIPLSIYRNLGKVASGIPFIVVITDSKQKVITYRETYPFRPWRSWAGIEPGETKKLKEIQTVSVGEYLSFKANGLVSFCLNGRQPLFFRPILHDVVSIKLDESGELEVKVQDRSYSIKVVEKEKKKTDKIDKTPPAKVKSVKGRSDRYVLKLAWQTSGDDDIDHYRVYRLKGNRWVKLDEVKTSQYTMDGKPWNSYTLRISAVDKAGNEGEPSNPLGIVAVR